MSQNTFLHTQNPDNAPLRDDASAREIRAHYSHVETLLRKNAHFKDRPIDDPVFDAAASAHHQTRLHLQVQHYGPEDVPGFKFVALTGDPKRENNILMVAVDNQGTIHQGSIRNLDSLPLRGMQAQDIPFSQKRRDLDAVGLMATALTAKETDRQGDDFEDDKSLSVVKFDWIKPSRAKLQNMDFIYARSDKITANILDAAGAYNLPEKDRRHLSAMFDSAGQRFEAIKANVLGTYITQALDPKVAKITQSISVHSSAMTNWLNGSQANVNVKTTLQGRPVNQEHLRQSRQNFAKAYPVLAKEMGDNDNASEYGNTGTSFNPHRYFDRLCRAREQIDKGMPAHLIVAKTLCPKMGEEQRAGLEGLTWQRAGRVAVKDTESFLNRWEATPAEDLPTARPGFKTWNAVSQLGETLSGKTGRDLSDVMRSASGYHDDIANRIGKSAFEIGEAKQIGRSLCDHLKDTFQGPILFHALKKEGLSDALAVSVLDTSQSFALQDCPYPPSHIAATFSLKKFAQGIEHIKSNPLPEPWYNRQETKFRKSDAPESIASVSDRWTPLVGEIQTPFGTARELSSRAAMDENHERVHQGNSPLAGSDKDPLIEASYALRLHNGEEYTAIVSLSRGFSKQVYAMEAKDDDTFSVKHILGVDNERNFSRPHLANASNDVFILASQVADSVKEKMRGGTWRDPNEAMVAYTRSIMMSQSGQIWANVSNKTGMDITDRKALDTTFQDSKKILPITTAVMGVDSLINAEQKRATWIANMVKNEDRTIAQSKKKDRER